MRFLIKTAFWLTLAFLVLPHTPLGNLSGDLNGGKNDQEAGSPLASNPAMAHDSAQSEDPEKAGPLETFFAAQKTLADFSSFCTRNASVCETGKAVFSSLGVQAEDGARIAYEYLGARFGKEPTAAAVSSTIEDLQAKMPAMPKSADGISIPIPAPRQSADKTDAVHTGTVKHQN
ncbi:hypothetical protein C5748_01130 [Phyllobacterium phragmitis]|uniref:DUF5330 domain-containing protein n=1 Tax=Phyllobacterium phragmitis TaxID=2670329 RepID=A0A2S9IZ29_9HYPH|nr:DUF5330 domain-containing protein [Phyllobacterium phragmitis]PRD45786.1 hypothetical protein C5748_01130 [Phyllobacterium phragmitis]